MTEISPSARMFQLTYSLVIRGALYAVARLGVADVLAAGPRSSHEIAAKVGSDPGATYRLLRALASEGVFTESDGRRFALTPLGATLRSDVPGSMRGWVCFSGSPAYLAAFAKTLDAARTGQPAWDQAHVNTCLSSTISPSIPSSAPPSTPP
jgi:hypothetical protein